MKTILLLIISNTFMTFAWYGHLKNPTWPLPKVILLSWGIAFFEYCFLIPANKIGYQVFSVFQLKIIQEIISISIFVLFAYFYFGEKLKWNHFVAFLFIFLAAWFAFRK